MTDWNLLAKYLDEQCSPAETEVVRLWSAADPAHAAELALLRRAWRRAGELPSAPRIEALWERLAQSAGIAVPAESSVAAAPPAVGGTAEPRRSAGTVRRRSPFDARAASRARWPWVGSMLAAAAVAVVVVGRVARHVPAESRRVAIETTTREYRTARGQRATIVLLDGTRAVLGVDSRLRVSLPTGTGSASGGKREAYLEGEVLFEVAHVASQPFVVHAGAAVAQDIGTTFGVRAYEGEAVRVVVVDGSVAVRDSARDARHETVLGANDLARIAPGNLEVERGIDPRPYVAWSQGSLVFRQARLSAVAAQLERVYDVRITITDSALGDAKVSATFADRDAIDAVLHTLGATLDAAVERHGQAVTIRPKR